MMLDWNDSQKQLLATIGDMAKLSPETVRAYRALSDAGAKTGRLDAKTRELIALAVSVTQQCDGCITVHTDAAVKQGASREEVMEALGVAIAVNAGATLVYSARVLDASGFAQEITAGRHRLLTDEPTALGGTDTGPSPYDLLLAALGSCTS